MKIKGLTMKDYIKAKERLRTPLRYKLKNLTLFLLCRISMPNVDDTTKTIIRDAVLSNRLRYSNLNHKEQRELAAAFLETSEQGIIDADHDQALTIAIANVIRKSGDAESMQKLYEEITRLFVTGDNQYEAYCAERVDEFLEEEWKEENTAPNEHFEHDAMQRARDMQSTIDSFSSHY